MPIFRGSDAFLILCFSMNIQAKVPILYPLKKPENTFGFLVFSGDIKWEHWPEMV